MDFVPKELQSVVFHFDGDFWVCTLFEPEICRRLMYCGFLPIATREGLRYYLLPKLHEHRCIIHLKDQNRTLHVSRNVRKKSKSWILKVNTAFDQVVQGCIDQHGEAWLYPPMVEMLKNMRSVENDIRVVSVELVHGVSGILGAGELGYVVGSVYTSLTGFTTQNGAGSIQLAALGKLLSNLGYDIWDLGMGMDYKYNMGAFDLPRHTFVQRLSEFRDVRRPPLKVSNGVSARNIIDGST